MDVTGETEGETAPAASSSSNSSSSGLKRSRTEVSTEQDEMDVSSEAASEAAPGEARPGEAAPGEAAPGASSSSSNNNNSSSGLERSLTTLDDAIVACKVQKLVLKGFQTALGELEPDLVAWIHSGQQDKVTAFVEKHKSAANAISRWRQAESELAELAKEREAAVKVLDATNAAKARAKSRLEDRMQELNQRSIFVHGLPQLRDTIASPLAKVGLEGGSAEEPEDVGAHDFGVFEKGVFRHKSPGQVGLSIWGISDSGKAGGELQSCRGKTQMRMHVSMALRDLAKSLPEYVHKLSVRDEVSNQLFGHRTTASPNGGAWDDESGWADLFSVRWEKCGVPCGVVNVEAFWAVLQGADMPEQLKKYMKAVNNAYGQYLAIGIMSTYDQWRFVFPVACERLMTAKTAEEAKAAAEAIRKDIEAGVVVDIATLAVSKIFKRSDPDIAQVLATGLCKMAMTANMTRSVGDFNKAREYVALPDRARAVKQKEDASATQIVALEAFLTAQFCPTDWLLLELIGKGADGDVWKAVQKQDLERCEPNGAKLMEGKEVRVLKLFREDELGAAEAELDVWLAIDEVQKVTPTPTLVHVRSSSALVLPLLDQYDGELDDPEVQAEIKRIAKAGYVHDDLVPRHAMQHKGQVVLIDLARMTKEGDETKAVQHMIKT